LGSQATRELVTREPGSHCRAITGPSQRAIDYSHGGRTREK